MALIDFLLNLAGLLLWLNWLSVGLAPQARSSAVTLAGTLRKASPPRVRRWMLVAGLAALLLARAFFYWHLGAAVNWTPTLHLGAITVSFPLSLAFHYLGLMVVYSVLSFAVVLAGFYLWMLFLSFLGGRAGAGDPFLRLARGHLGAVARWRWPLRLGLPLVVVAAGWLALNWVLGALGVVPPPSSFLRRLEQAALIGASAYLAWKYLIGGLLALHLLNSYVYLGSHPFWNFIGVAGQSLLRPLRGLPLRVDKVDFAPLVVIALVFGLAHVVEHGLALGPLPGIPGLSDLYRGLS